MDTYLFEEAIKDARKEGGEEFANSIKHLLENDLMEVKRLESGEFYYTITDKGRDYLENISETSIIY